MANILNFMKFLGKFTNIRPFFFKYFEQNRYVFLGCLIFLPGHPCYISRHEGRVGLGLGLARFGLHNREKDREEEKTKEI